MCACECVCVYISRLQFGANNGGRRGRGVGKRGGGQQTDRGVGVQVLLLRVPGAELGWAGLSDTLPSCEAGDVCARV